MVLAIAGSVGNGGTNDPNDVYRIKVALNQVNPNWGGPTQTLDEDGIADQLLTDSISGFQQFQLGFSDGRIDPNGATIGRLDLVMNDPGDPITWNPPVGINAVKLWINAFIPGTIAGLTQSVPAGPYAGLTMIPGPILLVSDCYLTDQRDFDADIHASSRMHSECEITVGAALIPLAPGPTIALEWHHCDDTIEVDCEDGDEECRQAAATDRMAFQSPYATSSTSFAMQVISAANNGCYGGSPDIDYRGTFSVELTTRTVLFHGYIDGFPAFEAYATADGGAGVTLFRTLPPADNTPWNITGDAVRWQSGSAQI